MLEYNNNCFVEFEANILKKLGEVYDTSFRKEVIMSIGQTGNLKEIDGISESKKIIVECKYFRWRENKRLTISIIKNLHEAVLLLKSIDNDYHKVLVLYKDINPISKKSVAQSYYEKYSMFLQDIDLLEIDEDLNITFVQRSEKWHRDCLVEQFATLRDKYIYALTKTEKKERMELLGITREMYTDKCEARNWFRTIAKHIHPDNAVDKNSEYAMKKLNEIYKRMCQDE